MKLAETTLMFDMPPEVPTNKKATLGSKGLKSAQLKAINWFCETNNYKPGISYPPSQMVFNRKDDGTEITVTLAIIMDQYKEWNDEDKKRRAKERKLKKEQEEKDRRAFRL